MLSPVSGLRSQNSDLYNQRTQELEQDIHNINDVAEKVLKPLRIVLGFDALFFTAPAVVGTINLMLVATATICTLFTLPLFANMGSLFTPTFKVAKAVYTVTAFKTALCIAGVAGSLYLITVVAREALTYYKNHQINLIGKDLALIQGL